MTKPLISILLTRVLTSSGTSPTKFKPREIRKNTQGNDAFHMVTWHQLPGESQGEEKEVDKHDDTETSPHL